MISIIILTNTILMTFNDYSSRLYGGDKQLTYITDSDVFFSCCYLFEFLIKIIAMGFITEKNTYLREGWNLIDFAVVLSTL